ncbi:MAG: M1 family aminopeptidase [Candidatus Cyclobacteriaceae bacterium M3_2C_046]
MLKNSLNILKIYFIVLILSACKVNNPVATTSSEVETLPSAEEDSVFYVPPTQVYRAEKTRLHDLLHTRLDVSFSWSKKYLFGTATLELTPYFFPQDKLVLDAKNFDIHQVLLLTPEGNKSLEYEYDLEKIAINLDREYQKGEKYLIEIDYTAKPYEREAGGSTAITSDRGLYFINADGSDPHKPQQIWTQGETEASSCWFPTIDAPNERTTQEMLITVDDRFETLSNGLLISSSHNQDGTRTDYWKMDLPHAPYLFMMAIGEFAIVQDQWEGMEVSYYVEPEYEPYARDIFGHTPEMLSFFSEKLGYKYPWSKYAQVVVRDYVSGAMENTTASVFMEDLQVDSRELLDYHWDGIIAHELFHQWIGDLVTCESWANLTLNEAFANYSEYLWFEYKYGKDEADYHGLQELQQYLQESESKQVDLIRFHYDHREDMFDSHSYAKGGRILHMLRSYLGDDAFFQSLQYYIKENAYSDVEVHDLRLAFEEVTGQDLNWFFNQWFLDKGHPQLKVRHNYQDGNLKVEIWQMQDFQETPLYKLPLDLAIWQGDKKITYSLMIEDAYQQFNFPVDQQPDLFLFDAKQQLLAEIDHPKTRKEYLFQYRKVNQFLARYQAIDYLKNDPHKNAEILLEALNDSSWVIRQMAINAFDGYVGDQFVKMEQQLIDLAKEDGHSMVRADAISVLSSFNVNKYTDLYNETLNDSSYAVLGITLVALSDSDTKDKLDIFNRFEHLNNVNVFLPIANYYVEQKQYKKYDWFTRKIGLLNGTDLWYMLQYFGEFLMNAPNPQKMEGVAILEENARHNKSYFVRLAAYQALGLLDVDGIDKLREDIRRNEKDYRLNQIYSNIN